MFCKIFKKVQCAKKEDVPTQQRCEENYFACDMVLIPMRVTLF